MLLGCKQHSPTFVSCSWQTTEIQLPSERCLNAAKQRQNSRTDSETAPQPNNAITFLLQGNLTAPCQNAVHDEIESEFKRAAGA